jgi:purine-binding chemotaxis protein CheW
VITRADLSARVVELRAEFDGTFARPAARAVEMGEHVLAIRAGGGRYAVRVADMAGLHADRPVTALPGAPPHQLGVTALRRTVVPVLDLRVLLGRPPRDAPRWLLLAAAAPVALAFDGFDGHRRIPPLGPGVEVVHLDGLAHPLVDVPALVQRATGRRC